MTSSTNRVVLALPSDSAYRLVCDAAQYPRWLVGAQSIPRIDDQWPAVGSKFEHRIGIGPLAIPGSTTVRRHAAPGAHEDSPGVLELAAGMGVLGEATVRFELRPVVGGTEVRIIESPRKGLAAIAAHVMAPLVRVALWGRNQASLAELGRIAQEQPATSSSDLRR